MKNGWGPAIVAFVAIGAHAVAILIHHLQLGMFENVLPRLLEAIHHILIWPILKTLGWIFFVNRTCHVWLLSPLRDGPTSAPAHRSIRSHLYKI
jgi:hypothetical protein